MIERRETGNNYAEKCIGISNENLSAFEEWAFARGSSKISDNFINAAYLKEKFIKTGKKIPEDYLTPTSILEETKPIEQATRERAERYIKCKSIPLFNQETHQTLKKKGLTTAVRLPTLTESGTIDNLEWDIVLINEENNIIDILHQKHEEEVSLDDDLKDIFDLSITDRGFKLKLSYNITA